MAEARFINYKAMRSSRLDINAYFLKILRYSLSYTFCASILIRDAFSFSFTVGTLASLLSIHARPKLGHFSNRALPITLYTVPNFTLVARPTSKAIRAYFSLFILNSRRFATIHIFQSALQNRGEILALRLSGSPSSTSHPSEHIFKEIKAHILFLAHFSELVIPGSFVGVREHRIRSSKLFEFLGVSALIRMLTESSFAKCGLDLLLGG